ncbi:MAG TPA: helix-turn-helix domain-containing protein [Novosphingobium sp.]
MTADNVTALNFFAALPGRVTCDARLTGLHFRILATIAGHDRMGRNGQCCWAGRKTLAERVQCAEGSFSRAVSDLIEWGYLKVVRNEGDARRVGYAVIYEAEADAAGIGSKGKPDRSPVRHLSEGDRSPTRHPSATDKARKDQLNQLIAKSLPNPNILCETQDITRSKNIPPTEGGAREGIPRNSAEHSAECNPKAEIVTEWFGEGGWNDGWEELRYLPELRWRWLIALWRRGALERHHIDEALALAEAARRAGELPAAATWSQGPARRAGGYA